MLKGIDGRPRVLGGKGSRYADEVATGYRQRGHMGKLCPPPARIVEYDAMVAE